MASPMLVAASIVVSVLAAMVFLATPAEVAKRAVTVVLMLYTLARRCRREPATVLSGCLNIVFGPIRALRGPATALSMGVFGYEPATVLSGCLRILFGPIRVLSKVIFGCLSMAVKHVVIGVLMLYTLARNYKREPAKVLIYAIFGCPRVFYECLSMAVKHAVVGVLALYTLARRCKREPATVLSECQWILFGPLRVLSREIFGCEPATVLSECQRILFGPIRVFSRVISECLSIAAKRVVVAVLMLYTQARLYKRRSQQKPAKAEASDSSCYLGKAQQALVAGALVAGGLAQQAAPAAR